MISADSDNLRLFFAVPLAEDLRDAACGLQDVLEIACERGPRVKWVERENLHLTLKFVGDTPVEDTQRLAEVAAAVASECSAASLQVGGVGCFPPRGVPRVIWVGLAEESPELGGLAGRLDGALQAAGLSTPDRNRFSAHFTLGRVKQGRGCAPLSEAIAGLGEEPVGQMMVHRFSLMSSELTPQGPIYAERACFDLKK